MSEETRTTDKQGQIWSKVAENREGIVADWCSPVWEAMLARLALTKGSRLLDAGCGSGEASVMAEARGVIASGLDAAPAMIERCVKKLPGRDFRVGDLEELPWPAASFDAAIACNCVHFTAHPDRAVAELRRVLRPGGLLAISCNGPREEQQSADSYYSLIAIAPRPNEVGNPFRLAEPGVLDKLVTDARFEILETPKAPFDQTYPDPETAYRLTSYMGIPMALIAQIGEERAKPLLMELFNRHLQPDGSVALRNLCRIIVARAI